jgi:hypothetical protein
MFRGRSTRACALKHAEFFFHQDLRASIRGPWTGLAARGRIGPVRNGEGGRRAWRQRAGPVRERGPEQLSARSAAARLPCPPARPPEPSTASPVCPPRSARAVGGLMRKAWTRLASAAASPQCAKPQRAALARLDPARCRILHPQSPGFPMVSSNTKESKKRGASTSLCIHRLEPFCP